MADVQLEVEDKNANLETPDGRLWRNRDGVLTLPDRYEQYAGEVASPRTIFRKRNRRFAGFDAAELAEGRKRWEEDRAGR